MNPTHASWATRLLPRLLRRSRFGGALPIGLHLGHDRLNMVQMARSASGASLRAVASLAYPCERDQLLQHPRNLKSLLDQAFVSQPFKGKRVVSCLPADQLKIISLSYRSSEATTDDQAIAATLRERMKAELDDMVVDYLPLRQDDSDSSAREALVALAPREHVLKHLELLAAAGLQVDALDIGPAALARVVRHASARHYPEFPLLPNALLLNFGVESSFLTVIWGRRTVLDRAIEFSESRLLDRLQNVLGMSDDLARRLLYHPVAAESHQDDSHRIVAEVFRAELGVLHEEISKTLVYMASRTRGKSVDVIFLAGPIVRYAGLLTELRQQYKVPVCILNPLADFAGHAKLKFDTSLGTSAGIAMTTGLALRGLSEHE
jgi:type IV pilus assembly protein PilM